MQRVCRIVSDALYRWAERVEYLADWFYGRSVVVQPFSIEEYERFQEAFTLLREQYIADTHAMMASESPLYEVLKQHGGLH